MSRGGLCPATMKARPPNMRFSVTSGSAAGISRSRSARSTSHATTAVSQFSARCSILNRRSGTARAFSAGRGWGTAGRSRGSAVRPR